MMGRQTFYTFNLICTSLSCHWQGDKGVDYVYSCFHRSGNRRRINHRIGRDWVPHQHQCQDPYQHEFPTSSCLRRLPYCSGFQLLTSGDCVASGQFQTYASPSIRKRRENEVKLLVRLSRIRPDHYEIQRHSKTLSHRQQPQQTVRSKHSRRFSSHVIW